MAKVSRGRRFSAVTVPRTEAGGSAAVEELLHATGELPEPALLSPTDQSMWAVIFAGGIGSRFWPLSTSQYPKQILALVNERPLIAESVARLAPLVRADHVLVVTSADIADTVHAAIPEIPHANMLIEPGPLGTAAALAWGAAEAIRRGGPDSIVSAMHADLNVGYPEVFRERLATAAAAAARDEQVVVLGSRPTRPETGFGYLLPVAPGSDDAPSTDTSSTSKVEHFVEKPSAALAETLIADGAWWNTGIFVARAGTVLNQLARHTSELSKALPALESGDMARFAELAVSVSLDRGLLERSDAIAMLPCDFGWDDVGTWASLRRVRELDDTGNGTMGECHSIDSSGNVVHADGNCVVIYGLTGMLVVSIDGLTFVTTLERASDLGPMLNALPGSLRLSPRRNR